MDHEGARRVEGAVTPDADMLTTVDTAPPEGRRFWLEEDMLPQSRLGRVKPTFKIGEVAKIFFARSPDWLRGLTIEQKNSGGVLELNGEPLSINRTSAGSRVYTLVDVERIAHALLENGKINAKTFTAAISTLRSMAYNYGILSEREIAGSRPGPKRQRRKDDPLPGIDAQIADITGRARKGKECGPCGRGEHGDCETAAEVAKRAWAGETVFQIGSPCACYASDPQMHE